MSGRGREHIPPVEGARGRASADREIDPSRLFHGKGTADEGQKAVVRSDEPALGHARRDGHPCAADSGVDDRQVYGPDRKAAPDAAEDPGRPSHISGRHIVSHIHEGGLGSARGKHPLHFSDVPVLRSEVGRDRDYAHELSSAGIRLALGATDPRARTGSSGEVRRAPTPTPRAGRRQLPLHS